MKFLWLLAASLAGVIVLLAFQFSLGFVRLADFTESSLGTPFLFGSYIGLFAEFLVVAGVLMLILKKRPRFWTSGLALGLTVFITAGRSLLSLHRLSGLDSLPSDMKNSLLRVLWIVPIYWAAAMLCLTMLYRKNESRANQTITANDLHAD